MKDDKVTVKTGQTKKLLLAVIVGFIVCAVILGVLWVLKNGNLGGNVTFRDMTYIEYSDGKFKFNANYNFLTGITYYWYCWRENT